MNVGKSSSLREPACVNIAKPPTRTQSRVLIMLCEYVGICEWPKLSDWVEYFQHANCCILVLLIIWVYDERLPLKHEWSFHSIANFKSSRCIHWMHISHPNESHRKQDKNTRRSLAQSEMEHVKAIDRRVAFGVICIPWTRSTRTMSTISERDNWYTTLFNKS